MLTERQRERAQRIRSGMKAAASVVAANADDSTLMHSFVLFEPWAAGNAYKEKDVVRHNEQLFQVAQDHTSQAHQPPDGAGMLAIYRPIQAEPEPGTILPWVSGEKLETGAQRMFNGIVYEALQNPGANIWEPPTVPAIWKKVE